MQIAADQRKKMFDHALENAEPDPEKLQKLMQMNLTTRPEVHQKSMALVWMQCQPSKWQGHNPAVCVDVAEMLSYHQEV